MAARRCVAISEDLFVVVPGFPGDPSHGHTFSAAIMAHDGVPLRIRGLWMGTPIYLEVGRKRVFACAVDWPGWCRSGRTEELAVESLRAYAPRYATVAQVAGLSFPIDSLDWDVRERVPGDATTDFGAPGRVPELDHEPTTAAERERLARLLRASWRILETVVAGAPPVLAKGPRGGGRDRDEIVRHVLAAETAYARKIGVRLREPAANDTRAIGELHDAILVAVQASATTDRGWPVRYACRRIAWHVLDHAWEIEDKSAG
jgi:hypothetical protein